MEPNPCVGAVVLDRSGNVLGEGATEPWGGRHAEIVALAAAGERARGATLLTTLEPCGHDGKKTPPCTAAIVAAGVSRVIAGCSDPNVATRGRAALAFAAAGVEYREGALAAECAAALERYAAHLRTDVPWTILKWAVSVDGRTADSDLSARWISGAEAREEVHALRGRVDAVVVGVGTVLADDPSLTCRTPGGASPIRVIFDSRLRTPLASRLVASSAEVPTWVLTTIADGAPRAALTERGVTVVTVPAAGDGRIDPTRALRVLRERGVARLLAEPGARLAGSLVEAGLVRQLLAYVAPKLIGGATAPGALAGAGRPITDALELDDARWTVVGRDVRCDAFVPFAAAD